MLHFLILFKQPIIFSRDINNILKWFYIVMHACGYYFQCSSFFDYIPPPNDTLLLPEGFPVT